MMTALIDKPKRNQSTVQAGADTAYRGHEEIQTSQPKAGDEIQAGEGEAEYHRPSAHLH